MPFSKSSSRQLASRKPEQQPEVAEREGPTACRPEADLPFHPSILEDGSPTNRKYATFLKRQMRPLTPPADLLARLNAALDEVDARKP